MRGNTVTIEMPMTRGKVGKTIPLYQYDYGQTLLITGVDLPSYYEVHFSNELHGEAVTSIGGPTGVPIPDAVLATGLPIYLWLYLHVTGSDGETEFQGTIPVIKRASISDVEPTPTQQSVIEQAIAALNAGVEEVEETAAAIPTAINTALAEAKASGEFDGADGQDGQDGTDGADGVSPTIETTSITGGYRLTITDASGTSTDDIMNGQDGAAGANGQDGQDGQDGADGQDGEDGYSPIATVSKSGSVTTITITDKTGTTTATVNDGDTGPTGATPSFHIGTVTTGEPGTDADATITGTDAEPVLNLTIPQGDDGDATVDDTAGTGDTTHVWSADKLVDEFALKAPKENPVFTGSMSMGRKTGTDVGTSSTATGYNVESSAYYSHAEGMNTKATQYAAHAEGSGTEASGYYSHAEGSSTHATEYQAHAEGNATTASGNASHSEGTHTTATNNHAHAEGYYSEATGTAAHAEGSTTHATGNYSHAEGYKATADGNTSHAEGSETTASGIASHAEGNGTTATGYYSHAEGTGTVANHKSQKVSGEYNVEDASSAISQYRGNYVEIVGNGTASNNKSNARALDWNGNERLKGDLYINCDADSTNGTSVATALSDLNTGLSGKVSTTDIATELETQAMIDDYYGGAA